MLFFYLLNSYNDIMKKMILFGDSNTYGYDPRGFLGGRYPEDMIWPSLVRRELSNEFEIIEEGQNGRTLPLSSSLLFKRLVAETSSEDYLVMMLGTNDILLVSNPNAVQPAIALEQILSYVVANCKGHFILIAPPYISDIYPDLKPYHDCSVEMNSRFLNIAEHYNIPAFDAGTWDIPMGSDGVHFSVEGHKLFAQKFLESINSLHCSL